MPAQYDIYNGDKLVRTNQQRPKKLKLTDGSTAMPPTEQQLQVHGWCKQMPEPIPEGMLRCSLKGRERVEGVSILRYSYETPEERQARIDAAIEAKAADPNISASLSMLQQVLGAFGLDLETCGGYNGALATLAEKDISVEQVPMIGSLKALYDTARQLCGTDHDILLIWQAMQNE